MKHLSFAILFIISAWLLLFSNRVQAQDVHFSQNYATPLFINPALTGIMNGDYRVSAVYRNQWASISRDAPFRTVFASADMAFTGFSEHHRLSVGLMLYNDKAGELDFSTNYADISLAYNLAFTQNTYISLGMQGGLTHRGVDLSKAQFGNQYDGGFDPTLSSGEEFIKDNSWQANVGGGILVYHAPGPRTNVYAGMGMYHLTTSDLSFTGVEVDRLRSRISVQAGGSVAIGSRFDVLPSLYFIKQGPHYQINGGGFARYIFSTDRRSGLDKAFNVGPWIRLVNGIEKSLSPDALIIAAKLDYNQVSVGVSYDWTLSGLKAANDANGGIEIAVVYTGRRNNSAGDLSCPKF